jgi:Questin oxidase-like
VTTHLLDETLERLHRTGPEFEGWLANHGPMAADALLRLGRADAVAPWVTAYERRLEEPPAGRWPIDPAQWREPLGDPTRLGDWCALLLREVHGQPWTQVLERWWPRLLPGALASASHGLIRTGHAVRSLREEVTGPRLDELGLALAYWAGRWQPVPDGGALPGHSTSQVLEPARVLAALDRLPRVPDEGGIRTRTAALPDQAGWPGARAAVAAPADPADVPAALDDVVDAAVTRYRDWAHGSPVMLVHAATAPRAAALVLPSLPVGLWRQTFDVAWGVTAAIGAAYRPSGPAVRSDPGWDTVEEALDACVRTGDEHAIKFAEVAGEAAARGRADGLGAASRAAALLTP